MAKAKREAYFTIKPQPKTLLLSAYWTQECQLDRNHFEKEFISLVNTAQIKYEKIFPVKIRKAVPSHFLTKGKLLELADVCGCEKFERIVCSLRLSAIQKRNLENLTECEVLDRNDLILTIFKKAAVTAEGQLQVKTAEIELMKTRMAGLGEEMGQQQAGAMARGPGETYKEYVKRFYKRIFCKIKKELESLQKARQVQRKRRIQGSKPIIGIVGYTNVGKSSLINALTKSNTLVEDKPFATLDTTTKELFLDPENRFLISDTIGFISNIPHNLIEAFKSTLDELRYADALLHVVDLSNPAWREQTLIVNQTLEEIKILKPMIYVFNKIDLLEETKLVSLKREILLSNLSPNAFISIKNRENFQQLKNLIKKVKRRNQNIN